MYVYDSSLHGEGCMCRTLQLLIAPYHDDDVGKIYVCIVKEVVFHNWFSWLVFTTTYPTPTPPLPHTPI